MPHKAHHCPICDECVTTHSSHTAFPRHYPYITTQLPSYMPAIPALITLRGDHPSHHLPHHHSRVITFRLILHIAVSSPLSPPPPPPSGPPPEGKSAWGVGASLNECAYLKSLLSAASPYLNEAISSALPAARPDLGRRRSGCAAEARGGGTLG